MPASAASRYQPWTWGASALHAGDGLLGERVLLRAWEGGERLVEGAASGLPPLALCLGGLGLLLLALAALLVVGAFLAGLLLLGLANDGGRPGAGGVVASDGGDGEGGDRS